MKNEINDEIQILIKFIRDIHIMNNLKANFLISMDILDFKDVIINISKKKIIFTKCENIAVFIQIIIRNNVRIRRIVRSKRRQIISFKTIEIVGISLRDKDPLFDRDFIFEPKMKKVYSHFVNANFNFINV